MIEAMQLNLPVVTTGYSGNMEFCTPETAFLVAYELIAPMPHEYIFVERGSLWADPSMASAAAALREVYENPGKAKTRADAAFRNVRDSFSIAAIGNRYQARLTQIQAIVDTTDDAA
jgi:glycosyltransferase involved in cell wall biosynthesis